MTESHRITTAAQLDALYGAPLGRSLTKEIGYISAGYRKFIEAAPFVIVATSGPEGLDCSPRGDSAGLRARARRKHRADPGPPRQQPHRYLA